ncbi:MAG: DNA topoisomerase [Erysipelotrichaceae bacterium]
MANALLIAEKGSVARTIDSYVKHSGFKDNIDCLAVRGHLITMLEPNKYKKEWDGVWNFDVLPMIPEKIRYTLIEDTQRKQLFEKIKIAMLNKKYDYIINACDSEREGELIFYLIYLEAGCKLPIKRYWDNGVNDDSIQHGLENLREYNHKGTPDLLNLRQSAILRANLDWMIGMNLTRAASLSMNGTAKIGRVKTALLKMIVDLENRISQFKPETSYGLQGNFTQEGALPARLVEAYEETKNGKETIKYIIKEFKESKEAQDVITKLPKQATLIDVTKKIRKNNAPKLYTLGDLQVDASSEYRYSVDKTLDLVQSLYEKGITSYPRTSNPYISSSEADNFDTMLLACTSVPNMQIASTLIGQTKIQNEVRNNIKYVNDEETKSKGHYALIPTGANFAFNNLPEAEQNILTMIVKRFVSIFLPPEKLEDATYLIQCGDEYFRANYTNTLDEGYTCLFGVGKRKNELPSFKKGDTLSVHDFEIVTSITSPPRRFSDGGLVEAMKRPGKYLHDNGYKSVFLETDGLGTEATRSEIIKNLARDGYIEIKGASNLIYAKETGMRIIDNLGDMEVTSVDLTARWETRLSQIETGKMSEEEFNKEMLDFVQRSIQTFQSSQFRKLQNSKSGEREPVGICPNCGGTIYETKKAYICENYNGESNGCSIILSKSILGAPITLSNLKKICKGELSTPLKMKKKLEDGSIRESSASLIYDEEQKKIVFAKKDKKIVMVCPFCGGNIIETDKYYYCDHYKREDAQACKFMMSRHILGATLELEDIQNLLNEKETRPLEFHKKDDKKSKFEANLILHKDTMKMEFKFKDVGSCVGVCPRCGKEIKGPYSGKFGPYYRCSGQCGFNLSQEVGGVKLKDKQIKELLEGKELPEMSFKKKDGGTYQASLFINQETYKLDRKFSKF